MTVEYRRGANYVYRPIVGEHILVALHNAKTADPFYALTPTGAELWEELSEWRSEQQLTRRLTEKYEVSAEQAAQDVVEFLDQLEALHALERREE